MKAFITGLVLIAVSGAALLWHLFTRPAVPVPAGPERTASCLVWKAERGKAVVWLCGSVHLLRAEDYPLPAPYMQAFAEAQVLVTETPHDAATARARREQLLALGRLPEGESLEQRLTPAAWEAVKTYANSGGAPLGDLQRLKPWQAAMHVASFSMQHLGYKPARGLESWFAEQAGARKLAGLETLAEQLGPLDALDAAAQETMLRRAVAEAAQAESRAAELLTAWREGDARLIASRNDEGMAAVPELRRLLMDERHAAWLPKLEQYLDGSETVMVLVGAGHLCGRGSLVELLEAKGARLTQMSYRTTRPAPRTAGRGAEVLAAGSIPVELMVPIVIVIIAVMVGMAVLSHRQAAARREMLAAFAAAHGWQFDPQKDWRMHDRYDGMEFFRRGSGRYGSNFISGTHGAHRLLIFDYHYETESGSGKNRSTQHHYYSVVALHPPWPLQPLVLRPEGLWDRITSAFGWDDIDFESAEFSRRYHVSAPDRRWAFDVLTPRTIEILLERENVALQMNHDALVLLRKRQRQPEALLPDLALAEAVLEGIPEFARQPLPA